MPEINDLLNRRSDLSTFVVHLTREYGGQSPKENLEAILASRRIDARNAMGFTGGLSASDQECMKVVCFSETPLEHVYSLFAEIPRRRVRLSPYGVAFTKQAARLRGANPVWYVDQTPAPRRRSDWIISIALDTLKEEAQRGALPFEESPVAKLLPFVEQMFSSTHSTKEFWWEREWRHLGNFEFRRRDVALVLCPESDIDDFDALGYHAIDPAWSLERMIAKLVGLPSHLATPFGS